MNTIKAAITLSKAGWILTREGVVSAVLKDNPDAKIIRRFADVIKRKNQNGNINNALQKLGPSWVKLGQFLATRPDIVGHKMANKLAWLQDKMEPFDYNITKQIIEENLGKKFDEVFAGLNENAVAASVAQVHKAKVKNKNVAVKVMRPGIRKQFGNDMDILSTAANIAEKISGEAQRLRFVEAVNTLKRSAEIEMDLRMEAAALAEMKTQKDTFDVPDVDWQRSGRDCLTMEWVNGTKLTDTKKLKQDGHDLNKLADKLNQGFLNQALNYGFFHADMHPGNMFVDKNGDIVAVDLGITGRLNKNEQKFLGEIILGFIRKDYQQIAQVHFDAGYVPDHHDVSEFANALRAVGEPIHGKDATSISMGQVLALLFEITAMFDMKTQTRLILLQKTMVVVEGVARQLNPNFNMWESAEPVVVPFMAKVAGPFAKIEEVAQGVQAIKKLASMAPEIAQHAKKLSEQEKHNMNNNDNKNRWVRPVIWLTIIAVVAYFVGQLG